MDTSEAQATPVASAGATPTVEPTDFSSLRFMAGRVFTPSTPVAYRHCFSGRKNQLSRMIDVIFNLGQHAILYGERGVGKTSMANILHSVLGPTDPTNDKYLVSKVNCDSKDTFKSVWVKSLQRIPIVLKESSIGFSSNVEEKISSLASLFEGKERLTPDDIRSIGDFGNHFIFIFDEFDRITNREASTLFADTIKNLSDYSSKVTIVLVGVGDNVSELIREHASINRCLIQILMPRMERGEIAEILSSGAARLEVEFDPEVIRKIVDLSQGLPHYAHLLGRATVRAACDQSRKQITLADLDAGIKSAITDAQHSTVSDYTKAISSQKKNTWFKEVLLAAALAPTDGLGSFAPSDLRGPLEKILRRRNKLKSGNLEISAFVKHLSGFSGKARGDILKRSGEKRKYRYRFSDPLMQPHVIMRGMDEGYLTAEDFDS